MTDVEELYAICTWCLAWKDARSTVVARYGYSTEYEVTYEGGPCNQGVRAWVLDKLAEGESRLVLDQFIDAYRPVAIWQGTPVCWHHLWTATDRPYGA